MSRALRLALFLVLWPGLLRAAVEVRAIEMTVTNLSAAREFYRSVLDFKETAHDPGRLQLGDETLLLRQTAANSQPIPAGLPANDLSFQHIAIVVSDIDAAYHRLQEHQVRIVSTSVQTLPDWNYDAADIRAVYFRDPDGHFLELIQFPPNKGEPRWHGRSERLFRGIDHTALVVSEMKRSVEFYRDRLGFKITGESYNYGGEQERLNGVPGSAGAHHQSARGERAGPRAAKI